MYFQSPCSLSNEELAKRGLAEINLATAVDLPQAGALDIPALCRKLDDWAEIVRFGTNQAIRTRSERRSYPEYTDAQFRILVMFTVLQRNIGLRYDLAFTRGEYDASDSRNLFIHGLLSGFGGTCVTLPVLYAAIARRIGYPVWLVCAKQHTFCRWDDPSGERFNFEATSEGFSPRTDEFYLTWPLPITPAEVEGGWLMRSMSPREELAFFLGQRGNCCIDNLQMRDAVVAFNHANQVVPDHPCYSSRLGVSRILVRVVDEMTRRGGTDWTPHMSTWPAPYEEWERQLYPFAYKELNRVLGNRRAKREALAVSRVFEDMYTN